MGKFWTALLAALRTSEFWALLFQTTIEGMNAPVPDELKWATWAYIVLRVAGKLARFIFPSPSAPESGWMKSDS